jgi:hypothetical protein
MITTTSSFTENLEVADVLDRVADLLGAQDANPHRVRAYRRGAAVCRKLDRSLLVILATEGVEGLDRLPGIGESLASTIAEYMHTGRSDVLRRLEGAVSPEDRLAAVPTIGEELARRIVSELGIDTLEELERAARDGRLASVRGFGPRRVAAVRSGVGDLLDRIRRRSRPRGAPTDDAPPASLILAVDEEYRRAAQAGELRYIKPRRYNPWHETWLPILHTERDGWEFTAHFSNSANAHRFGKTRDWVVVTAERGGREVRSTVVTERRGQRRVVRGLRDRVGEGVRKVST